MNPNNAHTAPPRATQPHPRSSSPWVESKSISHSRHSAKSSERHSSLDGDDGGQDRHATPSIVSSLHSKNQRRLALAGRIAELDGDVEVAEARAHAAEDARIKQAEVDKGKLYEVKKDLEESRA